jgi:hypothetical protein
MYTFPVVVPAVNHKSALLHQTLRPIWTAAEDSLVKATHVTVFGYSCPSADFESEHMIRRAFNRNKVCETLTIIDPSPGVLLRFVELTGMDRVSYCKNASRFLSW